MAGTGYTGEDGVEMAVSVEAAPGLWEALLVAGAEPAGLGRATPCGWRPGYPSTATNWVPELHSWMPGWRSATARA